MFTSKIEPSLINISCETVTCHKNGQGGNDMVPETATALTPFTHVLGCAHMVHTEKLALINSMTFIIKIAERKFQDRVNVFGTLIHWPVTLKAKTKQTKNQNNNNNKIKNQKKKIQ